MIGQTISHYKIVEELGRGGMGVVYKAEDTKLKRTVALKFLSPHLLTDETQKSRFLHEAQAAAALDHPNISTIHEVHEADGHAFMVMAYIEGEDVGTKLKSGPLDLEKALDIAIQVARGLAKAHSAGVVHRDIKPGNVIITPEGQAKIVDFGLAKLADQTRLTKTGTSVGTVRYMSPEQGSGGDVDHRTDIWSFGVLLYEMLAGEIPFRGEIEQAMIYSILHEDPQPITSKRKDVPIGLEDIIEKALAKDQDKRYATMDDLLAELETQRDHITLGIKERRFTAMRKLRRRKRFGALVGAVVVIVLGVMLMLVFQTPSVGIDSIAVLPFSNLSGDEEKEYFSDGMTELLINELGRIGALRVISKTSVMQFKKTEKPLLEIARELGVDAVVEASVLQTDDRIRITAQLIRAEPEEMLWSDSYNRDGRDVAILLSEVTRAIADRIQAVLTPEEEERLAQVQTVDPDALEAYLKGRYYLDIWTAENFNKAIQHFRQAIDIDPTYAMAYVGLSEAYAARSFMAHAPPKESAVKARAAVEKALELDDTIGEAHAMLAWLMFIYDWDLAGPEEEFQRAIELAPNSPMIYENYRVYLANLGRYDEAIAAAKRSLDLDPLTVSKEEAVVWSYNHAGMLDEVIAHVNEVRETVPDFGFGYLAMAYLKKGMPEQALAYADSAKGVMEKNQVVLSGAVQFYAALGMVEPAQEMFEELMALSEDGWLDPVYVASSYRALGDWDQALDWLERGYEERSPSMVWARRWNAPDKNGYRERCQSIINKAFPTTN